MSNSVWIMNFLIMLGVYGTLLSPDSSAWEFDFNGNGYIDIYDIMDMLAMKPQPPEFGVYEEK